ncbi:MAG TPA: PIN domain-containing protein [Polyangia bacterium]|nr:PIN domain-containing protein [Polyangia bacterium]
MIVFDSSALLALLDRGEPDHKALQGLIARRPGPRVVTDFVLAEVDFLILKRLGERAERAFVAQVVEGVFLREPLTVEDLKRASVALERYREHAFGLTDATTMVLAERLQTPVATLDRRHFSLFRDKRGKALEIVPG